MTKQLVSMSSKPVVLRARIFTHIRQVKCGYFGFVHHDCLNAHPVAMQRFTCQRTEVQWEPTLLINDTNSQYLLQNITNICRVMKTQITRKTCIAIIMCTLPVCLSNSRSMVNMQWSKKSCRVSVLFPSMFFIMLRSSFPARQYG